MNNRYIVANADVGALAVNKLIRNTYILLSLTLLFSAFTAAVSVFLHTPPLAYLISIAAAFILIWFVLPRTANSSKGLPVVFAITGLLGFSLGPILSIYLSLPNGPGIVATALAGTGVIFLALSGYALTTRKDFSFMGGFLFVGLLVVLCAALANIFLAIPALSLALSAAVILIMSGFILFDTSRMVHGGAGNYVVMTVSLYLNIFNIFVNLLQLLGITREN
ncbi:MAG TPA: Bax inhibitor-1/YccA family protein [Gammaproteobacteria bacterium]